MPIPDLIFEGRPAVWTPGCACRLDEAGVWQRVHSTEVMMEGAVAGAAKLLRLFGRLPVLQREAFA